MDAGKAASFIRGSNLDEQMERFDPRIDGMTNVNGSWVVVPEPNPERAAALAEQIKIRQAHKTTSGEKVIDLKSYATLQLTDAIPDGPGGKDNNFSLLPSGTHVFGGVPFLVSGIIQLGATRMDPTLGTFPTEKTGILTGQKFSRVHLLQGCLKLLGRNVEPVAELVLHYSDGTDASFQICNQEQVSALMEATVPPNLSKLSQDSELAWLGTSPWLKAAHPNRRLHLYRTTFANPHPELEVVSMDFVSSMTVARPLLVGLTVE
jgi:hypothetical protein